MLTVALTTLTAALADPSPLTTVPPTDYDGDGVTDAVDQCLAMQETLNAFADEDGCPDYLSTATLQPVVDDVAVPADTYLVRHDDTGWMASSEPPILRFVPGTTVEVAAVRECLEGEAMARLHASATLELTMQPVHDTHLQVSVVDLDGHPIPGARLRWVDVSTPGCSPGEPLVFPTGRSELWVGAATHRVAVQAPGYRGVTLDLDVPRSAEAPIDDELTITLRERAVPASLGRVHFDTDEASLDAADEAVLDAVAAWWHGHPGQARALVVEGHADERGGAAYNEDLSAERARAVEDYLAEQGVVMGRVHVVAEGESDPAAPGDGPAAWALDRRVTVEIVPQQAP